VLSCSPPCAEDVDQNPALINRLVIAHLELRIDSHPDNAVSTSYAAYGATSAIRGIAAQISPALGRVLIAVVVSGFVLLLVLARPSTLAWILGGALVGVALGVVVRLVMSHRGKGPLPTPATDAPAMRADPWIAANSYWTRPEVRRVTGADSDRCRPDDPAMAKIGRNEPCGCGSGLKARR